MPGDFKNKLLLTLGGLLLIAVIGYLDYLTSYQFSLGTIYLAPIALGAWLGGFYFGLVLAIAAALLMTAGDLYHGMIGRHFLLPYWDILIRGAGFLLFVYFIRLIRENEKKARELNEFIAHDLKTPLTNMIFSLENLQLACSREQVGDREKFVRIGQASAQRMKILIDSFLDIARLNKRKLPLVWSREKLSELIQLSLDTVFGLAQIRQVRIEVDNQAQRETIVTDRQLLTRVLINLLSNALATSPAGSAVTLQINDYEENGLFFNVIDHGRGLPGGELKNLFDLLEQGRLRKMGALTGSGLGLIFCKRAIEEMGGRLWLESQPGAGTTVCFTLVEPKPR
ncbi:MAG: HAMP domain-containing histidine kinase [Candidatus Saganbacteria bacterium]|nr:HAMP domain-containing histidine kinase [Candidatus Saganbacteria bacterium]